MDIRTLMAGSPSLLDYMGQGRSGLFDSISQGIASKVNTIQALANNSGATADTSGVNITLSEEAKKIMADGNASSNSNVSGVQKAGQNFLMSFFDQSGLDLANLSDEALNLIQGLQDVIAGSGATQRDAMTDSAEQKYNDGRQVYTLTGQGTRLRIAIDSIDGKPMKLSVTDISNGKVETAEITFEIKNGKPDTMVIDRTQREYANGHMVALSDIDPLAVKLYA